MVERRHSVERVRQGPEAQADRQHSFAIARAGVTGRTDDTVLQKDAQRFARAVDFRGHRYQQAGAFARIEHFLCASGAGSQQPLVAMNAPKFRVEEWAFEMHAETASAVGQILLQLVGRFDDLRCGVEHGLPRSGHDARHEAGRAGLRVRGAGDCDGVTLISIKEICAGAVCVHVDEARSYRAPGGQRVIGGAVGGKNADDAAIFDCQASERRRSIADRNKGGPEQAFGH